MSDLSEGSNEDNDIDTSDDSIDGTHYDTDDEAFSEPIPANLHPVPGQDVLPGQPITMDVNQRYDQPSYLPLCLLFNSRSVYNKADNLKEMLNQVGPDICLISETFERQRKRLDTVLNSRQFKSISYYRKNRAPGGGCAIVYNETRFSVTDLEIEAAIEIESVWSLLTPKLLDNNTAKVKRIAVGSYYVSPRSRHKAEIIEHIIESIHMLRAKYGNEVNFLIGGDFNKLDISDILECYGALRQIVSVPTRKSATLEILLTDIPTLFHPPTTLPPLQVDQDKLGKDSDHDIVVLAPVSNVQYQKERKKKTIFTRPLPESQIANFEKELISYPWDEMFKNRTLDEQVQIFHNFLRNNLDKFFPEKVTRISHLDKKWMSPQLKQLHRAMQREFYKHRRSMKYKKLRSKFRKLKRTTVKKFYSSFVSDLKHTNPGKWYNMARKIGAVDQMTGGEIKVESLTGLSNCPPTTPSR